MNKIYKILLKIKPGTVLKWILRPYVWVSDYFWNTELATCSKCKSRENKMNVQWEVYFRKKMLVFEKNEQLLD